MNALAQKPPIFIVGSQRSGTTMLRLMLNAHPHIAVPHESGFITPVYRKLAEFGDLADPANRRRLLEEIGRNPHVQRGQLIVDAEAVLAAPASDYRGVVDAIFSGFAASKGKQRWADKTPSYTEDIDIVRTVFPDCKIVHIVRDGRDVALSHKGLNWGSTNVVRLAQSWQWKVTIAHKVGAVIAPDYFEIRYEDLVREPETVLRQICDFVDEPFDEAMLNYSETAKAEVPTESLQWHEKSVRPPDPGQAERWRQGLSEAERALFEQTAGETLAMFGYPLENRPSSLSSRALKVYYTLIRRH